MITEFKTVLRSLARSPGYTAVVVATLALGIGAAAGFYSMFKEALRPNRAFLDPDRLIKVELYHKGLGATTGVHAPRYLAYEQAQNIEGMAAILHDSLNLVVNGEPEGVLVARVTVNYFSVLGVAPALGRAFLPEEGVEGHDGVAILGRLFWEERFASDPRVLGRDVTLSGRSYRIIGVLPENYKTPKGTTANQFFIPLIVPKDAALMRGFMQYSTVARLRPTATREQLQAELETMHPEKGTSYEAMIKDWEPVVSDFGLGRTTPWFRRIWLMNWTCLAAVSFLYAIACVNAGSLMLIRAVGRRREIGVRLALGGKRWQVVRPFLIEGFVLAIGAVGLGVLVARWCLPALIALAPGAGDSWSGDVSLSREALGGAIALGLLTGLVTAFVPAWRVARLSLNEAVKDGGNAVGESRRLRGLRGSLVIVEAALAVTLLVGTGLMVRTFQKLQHMKPGYETSQRYLLQLALSRQEQMSIPVRAQKVVQIMERLATVPGVTGAATAQYVLPRASYPTSKLKVRGQAGAENAGEIDVELNPVSAEYLELMGVPMRAGRSLAGLHEGDAPAAVINEAAVRKYFSDRNPIGQVLELSAGEKFEIVGVAGDVRSVRVEPEPSCYFPYWQSNSYLNSIVVRTAGEPGKGFSAELRRAVYDVDPKFSVTNIVSLEQGLQQETWAERQTMVLLEVLSVLALLLAVVGLFATLAYSVVQRRGEFGIRFALGASVASVYRLVVGRGLALVAIGVALGLGLAWSLAQFLESLLFETSTHDPFVFGLVGCLMLLVALPACWLPALRATKVDLARLMRSE